VNRAVTQSIRLVEEFATFTDGDEMINFDVPHDLGIGLARGAATALVSDGKVLDYSGRPLNLASRLMDIARPSGIVFDESLGLKLLSPDVGARFVAEQVYVKGLAESEPMTVYRLASRVAVTAFYKRPLSRFVQKTEPPEVVTLKDLTQRELFDHPLTDVPVDPERIEVQVSHPRVLPNGRRDPKMSTTHAQKATLVERGGRHFARLDYGPMVASLIGKGVKPTWPVTVSVEYTITE
jgi:hypothetical protein